MFLKRGGSKIGQSGKAGLKRQENVQGKTVYVVERTDNHILKVNCEIVAISKCSNKYSAITHMKTRPL